MKNSIGSKRRFLTGVIFITLILSGSSGCTKTTADMTGTTPAPSGTGGPGTNAVFIQGMSYSPATISVSAGTTITWTNKDAVAHTVTSSSGAFDSGSIAPNGTWTFKFTAAGTYNYICTFHSSMAGTVMVN
jgi:plastocyanin